MIEKRGPIAVPLDPYSSVLAPAVLELVIIYTNHTPTHPMFRWEERDLEKICLKTHRKRISQDENQDALPCLPLCKQPPSSN